MRSKAGKKSDPIFVVVYRTVIMVSNSDSKFCLKQLILRVKLLVLYLLIKLDSDSVI